ncbi:DHA2 family efflux MFS transporter permease subunit [Nocardia sp. alder85J]|uniref:DHA2 family efflux MFS transporter permease subunit n=1 Tax=Nocardia sp. alder85J TaxID=2862949 RepID=UPI001CD238B7|nr:DHA2 family efflux MFS transporter permease subunit [Nocardia sp. alder85J]MCX4090731.1 DHA2 family efflux MFS transporter permease subunit [Nocardia sp. alder85J]
MSELASDPVAQRNSVGEPPGRGRSFGAAFLIVGAGVAMSNLDQFIVNVALPQIGDHLGHSSLSSVSWVLNAYAVLFGALLVPAGNLADRFGARGVYLIGVAGFTVASLACALAPNVWLLVVFRAVQAVGAAAMVPASLGVLLAATPPQKRLTAIRGWTALSGAAAALGPALGGLLTAGGWRWVFLINVPIGLAVLVAGPALLPKPAARSGTGRPDLLGAALVTAAIGLLSLAVVKGSDWGWTSAAVLGSLAACVVLLGLFVAWCARSATPVMPLSLLRIRPFAAASLANLLFAVPFAAMLLSSVLWAEGVWHWSAMRTGLAVAPGPLMVPLLAAKGGPLVTRFGPARVTAAGCVVFAAGIGWWIATMRTAADYPVAMLPGMLLTGVGVGLTLPTLIGAAVTSVPPDRFATGSAVVSMARQVGAVLGVAGLVAVLARSGDPEQVFRQGWWLVVATTLLTAVVYLAVARSRPAASR